MPIFARQIIPPSVPSPFIDSRSLLLRTIGDLDEQAFADDEWMILAGITGLGLPPREVIRQTSPGIDGGWLRETRVGIREVFLPMMVASDSGHLDFLDKMDRVRGFIDDLAVEDMTANDGTLELVAQSVRGERSLRCVYSDGMEGTEGGDSSGAYWATFGMKLLAVDPWWKSTDETVLEFGSSATLAPFLSSDPADPWPRSLSPSVSLEGGGLDVTIDGTVPVWPTVEVVGPAASTLLTWPGVTTGEQTYVQIAAVASGEVFSLTTDPRRRAAVVGGSPAWSRVALAPQFARLRPGTQSLGVAVSGSSSDTKVRVKFRAAYKTAW